jgi:hypothetical protein
MVTYTEKLNEFVNEDYKEFVISLIQLERKNDFNKNELEKIYAYYMSRDEYHGILDLGRAIEDFELGL